MSQEDTDVEDDDVKYELVDEVDLVAFALYIGCGLCTGCSTAGGAGVRHGGGEGFVLL